MAEYVFCPGCQEHKNLELRRVKCNDRYNYVCLDCGTEFNAGGFEVKRLKRFGHKVFSDESTKSKEHYIYKFDNNYGASVIRCMYSHGYEKNLWELAVLKWVNNRSVLCFDTPIADQAIGWLADADVGEKLSQIKSLQHGKE